MDNITRQKLIDAGRGDLIRVFDLNGTGYIGCRSNGELCDRRTNHDAHEVMENKMMGIAKPKKLGSEPFFIGSDGHAIGLNDRCQVTEGMCTVTNIYVEPDDERYYVVTIKMDTGKEYKLAVNCTQVKEGIVKSLLL